MHATFITTTALALLSVQAVLAIEHGDMPKQNHARFLRVKRGGPTIHLIGDETVASWTNGGAPSLPQIQAAAPSPSSSWNLLDSINAGLGAPIGKATQSASASSSSSQQPTYQSQTVSSSSSRSSTSSSQVISSSSSSSSPGPNVKAAIGRVTAASQAVGSGTNSTTTHSDSAPTLALGRASRKAERSLPERGVVGENATEEELVALGRRAVAANATLAIGRNRVVLAATNAATQPATSASSSVEADTTPQAALALPNFTPAQLSTPQGWGASFANKYTSASVVNHGVTSATTRAMVRDLWEKVIGSVKSGDIVVIQLGHKESGMPGSPSDLQAGCLASVPGLGSETMTVTSCNGQQEVVQTYGTYISQMCSTIKAKGATCAVASITPKNEWKRDNTLTYNSPYIGYAKTAAANAGAIYIPHMETLKNKLIADGQDLTLQYFLNGNTLQSNAAGAEVFAATFAAAAYCAGASGITSALTGAGQAVKGQYC